MEKVSPYVVRITTPSGSGTGFLFTYAETRSFCAIATAAHVISHAHAWQQPIRVHHFVSGKSVLTQPDARMVRIDEDLDTAALVFAPGDVPFPSTVQPLMPEKMRLKVGVDVAWVGFPAVSSENLCLFTGTVSCWLESQAIYLVDGVAINGVSGGPRFSRDPDGGLKLAGVVSAYIPNRATGESLPGLSVVRDVRQLQSLVATFKSMEDAKESETPPSEVEGTDPPGATRGA
jgi:hypothetical protein